MRYAMAAAGLFLIGATACGGGGDGSEGGGSTVASTGDSTAASAGDSTAASAAGREVVLSVPHPLNDLDPHTAVSPFERSVLRFAYDTLLGRLPDGTIVSGLASDWEMTPGHMVLTLRDEVTCSDGTPLTASTVAANFERLKDPATAAPLTTLLLGSATFEVSSDDAANTVTLDLPAPFGVLPTMLTHYPSIICRAGLDDPARLKTETFGTGPFVLTDFEPGDRVAFEARDGYAWGPDGATTDDPRFPSGVVVRSVTNETTAANLLLDGELDLARLTEVESERVQSSGDDFVALQDPTVLHTVYFNYRSRPANPALEEPVRRALGMAIDRGELSQVSLGSADHVQSSVTQLPNSSCYGDVPADSVVALDLEEASSVLEGAGWTRDGGSWAKDGEALALDMLVAGQPGSPSLTAGEYVANAWRELGVDVNVRTVEESSINDAAGAGDWDVLLVGRTNITDPAFLVPQYTNPDNPLLVWLNNPTYDELVGEANITSDPEARCGLYAEADVAINEHVSAYPLFWSAPRYLSRTLTLQPYQGYVDPASLRVDD